MPARSSIATTRRTASRLPSSSAAPSSFQGAHSFSGSASHEGLGRLPTSVAASNGNFMAGPPGERLAYTRPIMGRMKVGLFVTCLVDLARPRIGFAALKLLEDAGCEVVVPEAQTCCGQPG